MSQNAQRRMDIQLEDNSLLPLLYGEADRHLRKLEDGLDVNIISRGNLLTIEGTATALDAARTAIDALWDRLKHDLPVGPAEVDAAIRIAGSTVDSPTRKLAMDAFRLPEFNVKTKRKPISARSPTQAAYLHAIATHDMTFGVGPAGTGKTYLAVAQAVAMLLAGDVDRIILSRPAIEAGERLGFLPGDLQEKIDPYLRPIYDALHDMMPGEQVVKRLAAGDIEVAPLAFMRGRTLSNAFVILDEAQNTTGMQMKMILTRLGEGSRMVITGDPSQTDLPGGEASGLVQAGQILKNIDEIAFVYFDQSDVVRHSLVGKIVNAYENRNKNQKNTGDGRRPPQVAITVEAGQWGKAVRGYKKLIQDAAAATIEAADMPEIVNGRPVEISVVLADDKVVQELNNNYRGHDKPTNVLSFALLDAADEMLVLPKDKSQPVTLGDVILSLDTLKEESKTQGKVLKNHMIHLVVHGVLHLLGYDHENDQDAEKMEDTERKILETMGIADPYDNIK